MRGVGGGAPSQNMFGFKSPSGASKPNRSSKKGTMFGNTWCRAIKFYGEVVSNWGPYGGREIGSCSTSPHPNGVSIYWAFPFNGMAFPFNGMAFPFTGRSQLLGVPMAWRRRQAMAKWRWGPIKWRGAPTPGPPKAPGDQHVVCVCYVFTTCCYVSTFC